MTDANKMISGHEKRKRLLLAPLPGISANNIGIMPAKPIVRPIHFFPVSFSEKTK